MYTLKRWTAVFLAVLMLSACVPTAALAADAPAPPQQTETETEPSDQQTAPEEAETAAPVPVGPEEETVPAAPGEPVEETVPAAPGEPVEETAPAAPGDLEEESESTPPTGIAPEVVYNTGRAEVTVGSDAEKTEDESLRYDLFREDGGYTINLDLFETAPMFPYEVQFTYLGYTESRWFETVDDTQEVGGHTFALACETATPQTLGFRVDGEYIQARPEPKEFTNEGGVDLLSMMPLTEKGLTIDLSDKLGSELASVTVEGGPKSGVWAITRSDDYKPFSEETSLDLSGYMGHTYVNKYGATHYGVQLELINGNDPLDMSLTRYIVEVKMCDMAKLLTLAAYRGKTQAASYINSSFYGYNLNCYSKPLWNVEPVTLKMKTGEAYSSYTAQVYLGSYATEDAAKKDPNADITQEIWDDGSTPRGPGYETDYSQSPKFTVVFKNREGKAVFVHSFYVYVNDSNDTLYNLMRGFDAEMVLDQTHTLDVGGRGMHYLDEKGIGCFYFYHNNTDVFGNTKLRLKFSEAAGSAVLPDVKVYTGTYFTVDELERAILQGPAVDVTKDIWTNGDGAADGIQGTYTKWEQSPRFTILLEQGTVPEDQWNGRIVLPVGASLNKPSVYTQFGTSLYTDSSDSSSGRERVSESHKFLETGSNLDSSIVFAVSHGKDVVYYTYLYGSSGGEAINSSNLSKYITRAVVGHCGTADEVKAKADIKEQLFSSASSKGGGYAVNIGQSVTFTVLDCYDVLHHLKIQVLDGSSLADRPAPLSDDTYFRVQGAYKAVEKEDDKETGESTSYEEYDAYRMSYTDDSYFYNGYQTVFLLDNGKPVPTDEGGKATLYPHFWAGSKVNIYAAHPPESGVLVEDGITPTEVEFGKPIAFSAGSESGTHLKNYWVTFVTQTTNGPDLFVNGVTNSAHTDKDDKDTPVREVFLDASHDYHHDIFFANIGNKTMTGLTVKLEDAENIALDKYWTIDEGKKDSLAAFTTVYSSQSYGELANVSKIRLVPLVKDGKFQDGEVSGTLKIYHDGNKDNPVVIKLTGTVEKPQITTESILPGVQYVHYSSVIQTNNMYGANDVELKIVSSTVPPQSIILKPNGELYGVPQQSGEWTFTVAAFYKGAEKPVDEKEYTLVIAPNTDINVWDATDSSYEITTAIPNEDGSVTIDSMDKKDNTFDNATQIFESQGAYLDFIELRLDGVKLTEGEDYTKEPGSTKITLQTQTLKNKCNSSDTHTLSAEFREGGSQGVMKRSSQNYRLKERKTDPNPNPPKPDPTPNPPKPNPNNNNNQQGGSSKPQQSELPFADVPVNSWFYEDAKWAYENGYMSGVSDNQFDPMSSIDQATIVTVLARMAKVDLSKFSTDGYNNITPGKWYSQAAVWATQAGLLPNYTQFEETGSSSRGSMAIMLVKYLNSMGIDTTPPALPAQFPDVDQMSTEENNAFQVLYSSGIFKGVGEMRMNPRGVTCRCEFSALVHRLDGLLKK